MGEVASVLTSGTVRKVTQIHRLRDLEIALLKLQRTKIFRLASSAVTLIIPRL